MNGLTRETSDIFENIGEYNFLSDYTLIGGSAISLQIGHRLSEDLDFCKWRSSSDKNPSVDWKIIETQLTHLEIKKINLLGFNQVDFFMKNGVKIGFHANNMYTSPIKKRIIIKGNIKVADLESIGIMKLELMLRRSNFRDYYDIYSILKEGVSLKNMVSGAGVYSKHRLTTKNILSFISNGENYKKEKSFDNLLPKYNVGISEIENFIKNKIKKEYSEIK